MAKESPRKLAFLLSEAPGKLSRDTVTIVSGAGKLDAGTVLGKITVSGKYTSSPDSGADGSQTGVAVLAEPVDATSADVVALAITDLAEVKTSMLIVHSTVNDATKRATKIAQLRGSKIKAR